MRIMERRILEVKHTKDIPYPEARKFIENSLATNTYANIPKPTNNSTQNQGMMTHSNKRIENTTWIARGKLDQLNNLVPHSNEAKDPLQNQTKQKLNPKNNKLQTSLPSLQNPTIFYKRNWITLKAHC